MCGYCTEDIALKYLRADVRGIVQMKDLGSNTLRWFYLRESPDIISALDRLSRSLAQKKVPFFSEVIPEILLLRGLEILLEQGFDSPAYQKLLKKSLYREAIVKSCGCEIRKEFETLFEGLQIDQLGILYDAETYFWGENSKQLRTLAHVLPSCRNLLKHYISWWLGGNKPKKSDLMAKIEELGILDRINHGYEVQTASTEFSRVLDFRFGLLVRALFLSILMVGSYSAGKKMLTAIVQREPAETPGFFGEDLWLQRVAAVKLYGLEGFEEFSKHLTTIRDCHYFYIEQVLGFTMEQKQILLDAVRLLPDVGLIGSGSNNILKWLSAGQEI